MHDDVSFLGSVEETQLFISSKINALQDGRVSDQYDIHDILRQLSGPIKKIGVDEKGLNALFEMVFSLEKPNYLRNEEKKFVIAELLIPNQHYTISSDLIYRILSNIGVEGVPSNRKRKKTMLPIGLQLYLLEWLLTSLHFFGDDVYQVLNRLLPILFGYLSYEFSRPYIANLISLSIINGKKIHKTYFGEERVHVLQSFKPWHVQLVVDLYYKFPMDDYLKGLLILFKLQDPTLNLNSFSKSAMDDLNDLGTIDSNLFAYPNHRNLKLFKDIRNEYVADNDLIDFHILENNLIKHNTFNTVLRKRKRQKHSNSDQVINFIGMNTDKNIVSINEIGTIENLVEELNGIQIFDSTTILKPDLNSIIISNKMKRLYLTIQGLRGNIKVLKRLDYYIKLTLLDEDSSIEDLNILIERIIQFSEIGSIIEHLNSLIKFIFGDVYEIKQEAKLQISLLELINLKLKIIPSIPPSIIIQNLEKLLSNTLKVFKNEVKSVESSRCFILFLSIITEVLVLVLKNSKLDDKIRFPVYEEIRKSVPRIFEFVVYNYLNFSLEFHLVIVEILQFVKSIGIDIINAYFDAQFLILEPPLVYCLLFSNNPMIFSELCGYIAFCKNYNFKDGEEKYRLLHNSYVTDILNFVWRDMALSHNTEINMNERGMLLTPNLINHLGLLPIFNYSSFLKVSTIGNIFQNPAWCYITARIIWNLEDKVESVTTRHEGPVSEKSVRLLKQNPDVKWLNLHYSQLKVAVLKELENLGYTGLCDLLFNSISSLLNER